MSRDNVSEPIKKEKFGDQKIRVGARKNVFGILKDWKVNAQKVKEELRPIVGKI